MRPYAKYYARTHIHTHTHEMTNSTNISQPHLEDSKPVSQEKHNGWYVCRYRMLTQDILELEKLKKPHLTIFLPIAQRRTTDTPQNCRNSRPVIPGFIFVKGTLADIRNDFDLGRYHIMYTHSEFSRPVIIRDNEMEDFMKIASILADNNDLIYSEEFEPTTRNIVEFNEEGESKYAYIETRQGVSGGNLIIPVRQETLAKAIYLNEDLDTFRLPPRSLCYKISTERTPFSILHIAAGNKYDLDYINTASKRTSRVLQQFASGDTVEDKAIGKIREYFTRYRHASTENIKFQARIVLMLYKCSIILGLKDESQRLKDKMETIILPAYKLYVDSVRKDKRARTIKKHEQFLQTFEHAKAIAAPEP